MINISDLPQIESNTAPIYSVPVFSFLSRMENKIDHGTGTGTACLIEELKVMQCLLAPFNVSTITTPVTFHLHQTMTLLIQLSYYLQLYLQCRVLKSHPFSSIDDIRLRVASIV